MPEKSPSTILSQVLKDIINVRDLIDEAQSLKNQLEVVNFNATCELKEVVGDTKNLVGRIQREVSRINSSFGKFYDSWKMSEVKTVTNKPEENVKKSKLDRTEIADADAKSCTQNDVYDKNVNKDVSNEIEDDAVSINKGDKTNEVNNEENANKLNESDKICKNDSTRKCNSNLEKNDAHKKDSDPNLDESNDENKNCEKIARNDKDSEDAGSESIFNDKLDQGSLDNDEDTCGEDIGNKDNETDTAKNKCLEDPVEKENGKIIDIKDTDNVINVGKCQGKSDDPSTINESSSASENLEDDIDSNANTRINTVTSADEKSKNHQDGDTTDIASNGERQNSEDILTNEDGTAQDESTATKDVNANASEVAKDKNVDTNAANREDPDDNDSSTIAKENEREISKNKHSNDSEDDVVKCNKKSKKSSRTEDDDEINGNSGDEPIAVDSAKGNKSIMENKNEDANLKDSVEQKTIDDADSIVEAKQNPASDKSKKKSKNLEDINSTDTSSNEDNPTGQDEPTVAKDANVIDSVEKCNEDTTSTGEVSKNVSDSDDQTKTSAASKDISDDEDNNSIATTKDNETEISEKENCKDSDDDVIKHKKKSKKSSKHKDDEINGKDTSEEETVKDKRLRKRKARKGSSDDERQNDIDHNEDNSSSSDKETVKKKKNDSTKRKTGKDTLNKEQDQDSAAKGDSSTEEMVSSKDKNENFSNKEIKTEWKIKCVDINTLIDTSILNEDSLSPSVVVISDSDTEATAAKNNMNQSKKSKESEPKMSRSSRSSRQAKKVIVLDDSDSSGEDLNNKKEQSGILRKLVNKNDTSTRSSRDTAKRTVTFNDSHVQSNSDDENARSRNKAKNRNKKGQNLLDVSSLSDCSSLNSNDDDDYGKAKKRNQKKKKLRRDRSNSLEHFLIKAQKDKKFAWKSYVPLPIIPAKKLKENYEKKILKTQIKRLTNMDSLKRSRSERRGSQSSSDSISEVDKKRSKKDKSKKKVPSTDSDSKNSGNEFDNPVPCGDDRDDSVTSSEKIANTVDDASKMLLSNINSGSDSSNHLSDDESDDKRGNSKKKGEENKKEKDRSEKDSSKKENKKKKGSESESDSDKDKSDKDKSDSDKSDKDKRNKDKSDKKKKWRKDKLLTEKMSESDSDENFEKFLKKKNKLAEMARKKHKRSKKIVLSDSDDSRSAKKSDSSSSKSSSDSSDSDDEKEEIIKKKGRSRIKRLKDSSEEEEEKTTRKNIRKVWKKDSLAETTIQAEKDEQERKARIAERQKKYNLIFEPDSLEKAAVDRVVLDFNEDTKEELLTVDDELVKHLKPHQAKGIQFMWDACFESIERTKSTKGSGCILAHCMGLGKTLQVITLSHTLIRNWKITGVEKILVVAPLSTVLNWVAEFKKWLPESDSLEVFEIVSYKSNYERQYQVSEWYRCGGVLIMGYDMFRNLTNPNNKRMSKKMRTTFQTSLVDPGPDLVICDEGHLLKNEKSSISLAMNRLQTLRRIVLTGTPLQNNLKEYFCMVHFVKPSLLGTFKEYLNRFVNPITNGQYTDSTPHDTQIMRKRSHVLHKLLDGVVQRKDYSVLAPYLPPKYEYVLFVSLTEMQIKLYEFYLKEKAKQPQKNKRNSFLFVDFQELQRICTHPRVLLNKSIKAMQDRDKKDFDEDSEGSLKDFIDDGDDKTTSESSGSGSSGSESDENSEKKQSTKSKSKRITRANASTIVLSEEEKEPEPHESEWFHQFCTEDDYDNLAHSGKLALLFEILRQAESIGDKVLVFSQSLFSLTIIEYFLTKIDDATQQGNSEGFCGYSGSWALGLDYFRLDGSSSCDNRAAWCKTFNNPDNIRARLFLISTRAGGLGINLVAANRVIIFDVSWNPSHDIQSIYRVYRFGQTKPSFIYRFVTMGSMEMKVYERQVIKQSISKRVIDEQQIDRHYNQNDIAELYNFDPKPEERPIPMVPKDVMLGELLQNDDKIFKYHEHQSLLENKEDEVLDEEERKAAWEEFENEKKARQYSGTINNTSTQLIVKALTSIVQKDNPDWDIMSVQNVIPTLLTQLEEQIALGDMTMYNRAMSEIRLMQAAEQQKFQEYYRLQQQAYLMRQYQQQLLGTPNPAHAQYVQQQWNQYAPQFRSNVGRVHIPGTSTNSNRRHVAHNNPNEVIDLND